MVRTPWRVTAGQKPCFWGGENITISGRGNKKITQKLHVFAVIPDFPGPDVTLSGDERKLHLSLSHAGYFYEIRIQAGEFCRGCKFLAGRRTEILGSVFFWATGTAGLISPCWLGARKVFAKKGEIHHFYHPSITT